MNRNLRIGLLGMGTVAAVAAPVALVVSCGGDGEFSAVLPETPAESEAFNVGMEVNYAPYNFFITPDQYTSIVAGHREFENMVAPVEGGGYAGGYDVYMANRIGDELAEPVLVHATEWDSLIPDLKAGSIESIIAGMSANPERDQEVDFSNAYFNPLNGFLYRAGATVPTIQSIVTSTTDIEVAVQTGTLWETIITNIATTNGHVKVVTRDDANLAELELLNGNVDYVLCENTRARTSIALHPTKLGFVEGVQHDTVNPETDNIAVALQEGSTQMAEINRIISGFGTAARTEALANASRLAVAIAA